MLVNICMKFHEDILNGFQVTERTRFCDGRTDDLGKNNMSPNPKGGRHNYKIKISVSHFYFYSDFGKHWVGLFVNCK